MVSRHAPCSNTCSILRKHLVGYLIICSCGFDGGVSKTSRNPSSVIIYRVLNPNPHSFSARLRNIYPPCACPLRVFVKSNAFRAFSHFAINAIDQQRTSALAYRAYWLQFPIPSIDAIIRDPGFVFRRLQYVWQRQQHSRCFEGYPESFRHVDSYFPDRYSPSSLQSRVCIGAGTSREGGAF